MRYLLCTKSFVSSSPLPPLTGHRQQLFYNDNPEGRSNHRSLGTPCGYMFTHNLIRTSHHHKAVLTVVPQETGQIRWAVHISQLPEESWPSEIIVYHHYIFCLRPFYLLNLFTASFVDRPGLQPYWSGCSPFVFLSSCILLAYYI